MNNKRVSIIIPVYNGSNYLREAIDSALNQTYTNTEVIVVNDGSDDGGATEKIALSYGEKIRYYYKPNGGVSSALNFGISKMTGDFFSWLSHDDMYSPKKIEKQIAAVAQLSCATIAVCNGTLVNANAESVRVFYHKNDIQWNTVFSGREILKKITVNLEINGCSLLVPREAFTKAGGFDESMRYTQDRDMWYRLCFEGYPWVFVNYNGVLSRVHPQQVTQTRRDLLFIDSEKMAKKIVAKILFDGCKEKDMLLQYTLRCARLGCRNAVNVCVTFASEHGLLCVGDKVLIFVNSLYGAVRPFIRKMYYRIIRRVKI